MLTRRKARQFVHSKSLQLALAPSKQGVSQKSGGCLEALPTEIFILLQGLLSYNEYRNLMDSNVSTFELIKYETLRYQIRIPDLQEKRTVVVQVINRVKDKSRQISLKLEKATTASLLEFAYLFEGIYSLTVTHLSETFKNDFPSKVFDSVYILKLHWITGIKTLKLNSSTLMKLEIIHCLFEFIPRWNEGNQLQSLVYHRNWKSNIISPPSFEGISHIDINYWNNIDPHLFGNNRSFTCTSSEIVPSQILHGTVMFRQLTSLTLICNFPQNFTDFSSCSHIQFLSLKQRNGYSYSTKHLPFPIFYGQEITLRKFSLFSWNNGLLPNLRKCVLENCTELISFPEAPKTTDIAILNGCSPSSFPKEMPLLVRLKVTSCQKLTPLPYFPKLKEVNMKYCTRTEFNGYDTFSHVRSLVLEDWNLKNINFSLLRKVKNLKLINCCFFSLEGISGTNTLAETEKRSIIIKYRDYFFGCASYMSIHHIYRLELYNFDITTLHGINNIHHLVVHCPSLTTTDGLESVTGSLTLQCSTLLNLKDVKNIPIVRIINGQSINDISGLENHQEVHVCGAPYFDKRFNKAQRLWEFARNVLDLKGRSVQHFFHQATDQYHEEQIW
jgi:hypothetical protein